MTRHPVRLPFAALVCGLAIALPARAQAPRTAEDSVRAVDAAWARSYATHDTVLAASIFADDIVITATDGSLKDQRVELRDVAPSPGMTVDFFRTASVNVRMLPGAAVVTGLLEWRTTSNGRSNDARRRYTAVYGRGGSLGWTMVNLHIGRAP
jgi:ketosteroid isomerase-like protein